MNDFFERVKREVAHLELQTAANGSETFEAVSLTADVLLALLNQFKIQEIQKLDVVISGSSIVVKGEARKLMIKIPFSVSMKPAEVREGKIRFIVKEMSPVNVPWLNQKIFNHPPYVVFEEGCIYLSLKPLDYLQKLKNKTIDHVEIKNDKLMVLIRPYKVIQRHS
ncbi:hypothetical protein [Ammoniphilus sp. 3BR4]|uniref:hypothetical protein n=1 Tax=Ammoniphilus sp. 3BR4 TaxID=3158265 RepID=UPI00346547F9